MKFKVKPSPLFRRQAKEILKKHRKMKAEIRKYLEGLETGPKGKRMPGYAFLFKDRIPMKPYGTGKRGGLRIICYHDDSTSDIFPLMIYSKSVISEPTKEMLMRAIRELESVIEAEENSGQADTETNKEG